MSAYVVKSLVHASQVLGCFSGPGEVLRLRDVVQRTGMNKGMCFRLLYTLHECGFLEKSGQNSYRSVLEIRRRRRYRIGYAAQGQDSSFPREILAGLTAAAEREQVELGSSSTTSINARSRCATRDCSSKSKWTW